MPLWVVRLGLSGTERQLYEAIALHADRYQRAEPAVQTLADIVGLDRRTVQRTLRRLEERGMIEAMTEGRGGRGQATRYRLPRTEKGGAQSAAVSEPERAAPRVPLFPSPKGRQIDPERAANRPGKGGAQSAAQTENREQMRARAREEPELAHAAPMTPDRMAELKREAGLFTCPSCQGGKLQDEEICSTCRAVGVRS